MSRINLDTQTIQKINYEIQGLDATLTKTYIPGLQASVNNCHANVQNTDIKALLAQIDSQLNSVNAELATNLTNLEEFLSSQVVNYQAASDIALQDINNALSQMQQFAVLKGTAVTAAGAATGNNPSSPGGDVNGTVTPGDTSTTPGATGNTADGELNAGHVLGSAAVGATIGGFVGGPAGAAIGAVAGGAIPAIDNAIQAKADTPKENDNSIYGAMGTGALAGAAVGAVAGGPVGAAIGAGIGAAVPVVVDLGGKVIQGAGWLLNQAGSAIEGWFQW